MGPDPFQTITGAPAYTGTVPNPGFLPPHGTLPQPPGLPAPPPALPPQPYPLLSAANLGGFFGHIPGPNLTFAQAQPQPKFLQAAPPSLPGMSLPPHAHTSGQLQQYLQLQQHSQQQQQQQHLAALSTLQGSVPPLLQLQLQRQPGNQQFPNASPPQTQMPQSQSHSLLQSLAQLPLTLPGQPGYLPLPLPLPRPGTLSLAAATSSGMRTSSGSPAISPVGGAALMMAPAGLAPPPAQAAAQGTPFPSAHFLGAGGQHYLPLPSGVGGSGGMVENGGNGAALLSFCAQQVPQPAMPLAVAAAVPRMQLPQPLLLRQPVPGAAPYFAPAPATAPAPLAPAMAAQAPSGQDPTVSGAQTLSRSREVAPQLSEDSTTASVEVSSGTGNCTGGKRSSSGWRVGAKACGASGSVGGGGGDHHARPASAGGARGFHDGSGGDGHAPRGEKRRRVEDPDPHGVARRRTSERSGGMSGAAAGGGAASAPQAGGCDAGHPDGRQTGGSQHGGSGGAAGGGPSQGDAQLQPGRARPPSGGVRATPSARYNALGLDTDDTSETLCSDTPVSSSSMGQRGPEGTAGDASNQRHNEPQEEQQEQLARADALEQEQLRAGLRSAISGPAGGMAVGLGFGEPQATAIEAAGAGAGPRGESALTPAPAPPFFPQAPQPLPPPQPKQQPPPPLQQQQYPGMPFGPPELPGLGPSGTPFGSALLAAPPTAMAPPGSAVPFALPPPPAPAPPPPAFPGAVPNSGAAAAPTAAPGAAPAAEAAQPALRTLLGEAAFNGVRASMMRQQSVFVQQLCELHKIARVQQVIWSELLVLDPAGMHGACTAAGFAAAGPNGPIALPPPLPELMPPPPPPPGSVVPPPDAGPEGTGAATSLACGEGVPTLESAAAAAVASGSVVASGSGAKADPRDGPNAVAGLHPAGGPRNAAGLPGAPGSGEVGLPPRFGSSTAAAAHAPACRAARGGGPSTRPALPPPVPPERLRERLVCDMQLLLNVPRTLRDKVFKGVPPHQLVRPPLPTPPAVRPAATAAVAGGAAAGGGGEVVRPAASKLYTMMLGPDEGPQQSEQPSVVQQLPRRGGGGGERVPVVPQNLPPWLSPGGLVPPSAMLPSAPAPGHEVEAAEPSPEALEAAGPSGAALQADPTGRHLAPGQLQLQQQPLLAHPFAQLHPALALAGFGHDPIPAGHSPGFGAAGSRFRPPHSPSPGLPLGPSGLPLTPPAAWPPPPLLPSSGRPAGAPPAIAGGAPPPPLGPPPAAQPGVGSFPHGVGVGAGGAAPLPPPPPALLPLLSPAAGSFGTGEAGVGAQPPGQLPMSGMRPLAAGTGPTPPASAPVAQGGFGAMPPPLPPLFSSRLGAPVVPMPAIPPPVSRPSIDPHEAWFAKHVAGAASNAAAAAAAAAAGPRGGAGAAGLVPQVAGVPPLAMHLPSQQPHAGQAQLEAGGAAGPAQPVRQAVVAGAAPGIPLPAPAPPRELGAQQPQQQFQGTPPGLQPAALGPSSTAAFGAVAAGPGTAAPTAAGAAAGSHGSGGSGASDGKRRSSDSGQAQAPPPPPQPSKWWQDPNTAFGELGLVDPQALGNTMPEDGEEGGAEQGDGRGVGTAPGHGPAGALAPLPPFKKRGKYMGLAGHNNPAAAAGAVDPAAAAAAAAALMASAAGAPSGPMAEVILAASRLLQPSAFRPVAPRQQHSNRGSNRLTLTTHTATESMASGFSAGGRGMASGRRGAAGPERSAAAGSVALGGGGGNARYRSGANGGTAARSGARAGAGQTRTYDGEESEAGGAAVSEAGGGRGGGDAGDVGDSGKRRRVARPGGGGAVLSAAAGAGAGAGGGQGTGPAGNEEVGA